MGMCENKNSNVFGSVLAVCVRLRCCWGVGCLVVVVVLVVVAVCFVGL